jgi:hypothetical protein
LDVRLADFFYEVAWRILHSLYGGLCNIRPDGREFDAHLDQGTKAKNVNRLRSEISASVRHEILFYIGASLPLFDVIDSAKRLLDNGTALSIGLSVLRIACRTVEHCDTRNEEKSCSKNL